GRRSSFAATLTRLPEWSSILGFWHALSNRPGLDWIISSSMTCLTLARRRWRASRPGFGARSSRLVAASPALRSIATAPARRAATSATSRRENMSTDEGALVLFSGGQDSATCLAWALERFNRVETVGFDYGQRHRIELDCRDPIRSAIIKIRPGWKARLHQDHTINMRSVGE